MYGMWVAVSVEKHRAIVKRAPVFSANVCIIDDCCTRTNVYTRDNYSANVNVSFTFSVVDYFRHKRKNETSIANKT